ncbi:MAG TPA: RNase adaptor protein RapZ, partial [Actinobacteria bacterium]|nr:RNase adaptor protein RapZ [Actinomycetota bacterium]
MHSHVEMIIITGESGAGKSHAMAAFEDAGFFCIDNLPPQMIEATGDLFVHKGSKVKRAAVVTDVRGGEYFEEIGKCLKELENKDIPFKLLYLEASSEALLRRFKETRRPHPLAPDGDVLKGIQLEKKKLVSLKKRADWVIDSSEYNVHELRSYIIENIVPQRTGGMIV